MNSYALADNFAEKLRNLAENDRLRRLKVVKKWNRLVSVSLRRTAAIFGTVGILAFSVTAAAFSDPVSIEAAPDDLSVRPKVSVFEESRRSTAGFSITARESGTPVYQQKTAPEVVMAVSADIKDKAAAADDSAKLSAKKEALKKAVESRPELEVEFVESEPEVFQGVISYTQQEFDMMCSVVMHEVGYCSEQMKLAISNVIINRVKSEKFPNNIYDVLHQYNQFTAINNYYYAKYVPDEDTVSCVRRALNGEGAYLVNGGDSYYATNLITPDKAQWFETHLTYCTTLENARFFKV